MSKLAISMWPENERPRERMLFQGGKALTNAELVALLLSTGNRADSKSAVDLAMELLEKYKSFKRLAEAPIKELVSVKGIGLAKAARIKSCFEISNRIEKQSIQLEKHIYCAEDVFNYFKSELNNSKNESTALLFLDGKNRILSEKLFKGGFNHTSISPRQLVEESFRLGAVAVIVCHNHPSGNTNPTETDLTTTKELKSILGKIELILLDHVIIGKNDYFSFGEKGLL